ncbi:MAG: TIGR04013 family B12-binding domain/radical SAM domain-containing protein [Atribacterota bacterium]|nr:TIGR04013 family B12-binding domain/radical SAM domain-containing protein [Candidatus Atribacteria bacterium]
MDRPHHLVVFYSSRNRNSMNALLGALQTSPVWENLRIHLPCRKNEVLETIKKYPESLLVLSIMTPDLPDAQKLIQECRLLSPPLLVCAGGPHVSAVPEDLLPWVDWLIPGEGEEAFSHLVEKWARGEIPEPPGIIRTSHRVELDQFPPFPSRIGIFGLIEVTRGCPYGCYYCQTSSIFGKDVRHRSVECISGFLSGMKKKRLLDIRFITPNAFSYGSPDGFLLNLPAVSLLLEETKKITGKKGRIFFGSFPSEIRPEFVTPDSLRLLREFTDNDNVVLGAQSGSNRMLRAIGRGHTREDFLRAAELCRRYRYKVLVDFIFGLPGENEDDEKETLGAMKYLTDMGAMIHAHSFMPLPGTFFALEKPVPISPFMKRQIGKMARDGFLFGQWQTQQKYAREMSTLKRG